MIPRFPIARITLATTVVLLTVGCGAGPDQMSDDMSAESRGDDRLPTVDSTPPISGPISPLPETELERRSVGAAAPRASAPDTVSPAQQMRAGSAPKSKPQVIQRRAMAADVPSARSGEDAGQAASEQEGVSQPLAARPDATDAEGPGPMTTIQVFYATDRESRYGLSSHDWWSVHLPAMIAAGIFLIAFVLVFLISRKVLPGLVAFASLAVFLYFAQAATVEWQRLERLSSHGDPEYLSEIRSSGPQSLDYGTCEVSLPPSHQIGRLDSPSVLRLEFSENPQKHVVLHRVIKTDQDAFYELMSQAMDRGESRQGLIFIHGYNVSFDDAVKRTAQIAHDLEFDGVPICYSWSSRGSLANYTHDMANADATVVALQGFLQETVRRSGRSTLHLIAHSMGNRALLQALDRIAVSQPDQKATFGQLIMAAPDVSERDFRNRYVASARQLARKVTLYASSRDRALLASTEIHGHDRAGLAGSNLVVVDGVDTIDVSEIDTSLIGHSYYGDHPELIRDLRALVELSRPASQRSWLKQIFSPQGFSYFRFADALGRSAQDPESPASRQRK